MTTSSNESREIRPPKVARSSHVLQQSRLSMPFNCPVITRTRLHRRTSPEVLELRWKMTDVVAGCWWCYDNVFLESTTRFARLINTVNTNSASPTARCSSPAVACSIRSSGNFTAQFQHIHGICLSFIHWAPPTGLIHNPLIGKHQQNQPQSYPFVK